MIWYCRMTERFCLQGKDIQAATARYVQSGIIPTVHWMLLLVPVELPLILLAVVKKEPGPSHCRLMAKSLWQGILMKEQTIKLSSQGSIPMAQLIIHSETMEQQLWTLQVIRTGFGHYMFSLTGRSLPEEQLIQPMILIIYLSNIFPMVPLIIVSGVTAWP